MLTFLFLALQFVFSIVYQLASKAEWGQKGHLQDYLRAGIYISQAVALILNLGRWTIVIRAMAAEPADTTSSNKQVISWVSIAVGVATASQCVILIFIVLDFQYSVFA